jgi:hypothetical protein
VPLFKCLRQAAPIAYAFLGIYGFFLGWAFLSYMYYNYAVLPTLAFAKNTEIEELGSKLSTWPRIKNAFRNDGWWVFANFVSALLVVGGFVTNGMMATTTYNSAAIFAGSVGSFMFGLTIFMPNHALSEPTPEMRTSRLYVLVISFCPLNNCFRVFCLLRLIFHTSIGTVILSPVIFLSVFFNSYTKNHPPVEKDKYYVVTPAMEEIWRGHPEAWTFESTPWKRGVCTIENAEVPLSDVWDAGSGRRNYISTYNF